MLGITLSLYKIVWLATLYLKSWIKNGMEVTLNLSSVVIDGSDNDFQQNFY